MADDEQPAAPPAHRPSRRNEILDVAIHQFARKGLVDTALSDVAAEAGVVVTAIYYHFASKEELYSAAVSHVFESISEVVVKARGDDEPGHRASLDDVIDAVWTWIDDHPDEATLFYLQLPGATREVTRLRREFEDAAAQRAFGYLADGTKRGRPSAARRGIETLVVRTLVDLLISVHTMRLYDGPLSEEPADELRAAVHALAARLVSA